MADREGELLLNTIVETHQQLLRDSDILMADLNMMAMLIDEQRARAAQREKTNGHASIGFGTSTVPLAPSSAPPARVEAFQP